MKIFTYEEYIEYKKQVKIYADKHFKLSIEKQIFLEMYNGKEELKTGEIYEYWKNSKRKINNIQLQKKLENKTKIIPIINNAVKDNLHLTPEMLQMYKSSYINTMFQNGQISIIYRIIGTNIFFLITHQEKIDYTMPARILSYIIGVIDKALKNVEIRRHMKIPTVIPIIVYTGNEQWNMEQFIKNSQKKLYPFQKIGLGEYNILKMFKNKNNWEHL